MNSKDLTAAQCAELKEKVAAHGRWLNALMERMEQQGFPPDDVLKDALKRAIDRHDELWMKLHYLECDRNQGRGR